LNILFCGDENVANGIKLSALSLSKHTDKTLNIYIFTAGMETAGVIHNPIPQVFAKKLEDIIKCKDENSTVTLLDISDIFGSYLPKANMDTRFTPFCMLRLFADMVEIIPDRILYLDADVLCRKSFSEIYDCDIDNAEIAGVPDRYGKWFFGNVLKHDYLNSGVLVMNMKNIRMSGLFEKCRALCADKKMFMPDQTALNKLAIKKKLPRKFNEQGKIRKETVFKHFTTYFEFFPYFHAVTVKPWDVDRLHSKLGIYEFDDIVD